MKRNHQLAVVVALAAVLALPLYAQNTRVFREGNAWVEETTGTLPSPRAVRINSDMGAISVVGGSQRDLTYTVRKRVYTDSEDNARRQFAAFRVTAVKRGDQAIIEATSEHNFRKFSADFSLQAPREIDLVRAETGGGSITVRNIAGRVDTESGGGSVSLSDISGPISAETGGGSVEVTNSSNVLNLRTGGGSIRINSPKGKVRAQTGGGNISVGNATDAVFVETGGGSVDVRQCGSELQVSTGGGSIEVGDVNGMAVLDTGGGSIRLTSAKGMVKANTGGGSIELYKLLQGARAETGAGSITAEFLGFNTESSLQTSVGDVIVYLSPQAKVTVRASLTMANGHKIIAGDFPGLKITREGSEYGPSNYYAEGALNGGGPVLRVRTMSGNIEFRRAR